MEAKIEIATIHHLKSIQNLNYELCKKEVKDFDPTINSKYPLTKTGEDYFKERITKDDGCAFVLLLNEQVIGYLVGGLSEVEDYRNISDLAELENMFILEQYRGGGFGSKLYDSFISWCKNKKVKRIKVVASARNIQALNFYRKQGFVDYDITLEKVI